MEDNPYLIKLKEVILKEEVHCVQCSLLMRSNERVHERRTLFSDAPKTYQHIIDCVKKNTKINQIKEQREKEKEVKIRKEEKIMDRQIKRMTKDIESFEKEEKKIMDRENKRLVKEMEKFERDKKKLEEKLLRNRFKPSPVKYTEMKYLPPPKKNNENNSDTV